MTEMVRSPAHWALKSVVALGLLADAVLAGLLLFATRGVLATSNAALLVGWGMAIAVCIVAPLMAIPIWRGGRRILATATVWLPGLALLVGIGIGSL